MAVTISGGDLTIAQIGEVARGAPVRLSDDPAVLERIEKSRRIVQDKIARGEQVYGVTTLFGGMADRHVGPDLLRDVQTLALWQHRSTTGPLLSVPDTRAAMLLRANSLMKGASGIRLEIIERFAAFLNAGATPHVYERGSIGASGDLVPLTYIGGSIVGLDPAFLVDFKGETLDCHTALKRLDYSPLPLEPKEGLALNNGTGASTGVAANAVDRAFGLVSVGLGVHALVAQALLATSQSYAPFIHAVKPHPGQIWTARAMAELTKGSKVMRDEAAGDRGHREGTLIQDRYSLRCLPQFIGPIIDGLSTAAGQIEIEANCANDNPLVDPDSGEIFHTGNFLAQYTSVAMDQLRYHLGMMAKHVDVQLALLFTPEFSYGLSPSLIGKEGGINVGLKSLQVHGNQMMPLLGFYGQSMADRFPTHAEQYNQNINSQAMNSAVLARDALDVCSHFLAVALLCSVQACELRAKLVADSYDARTILSPATAGLYTAVRTAALGAPDAARPLQWEDLDEFIQPKVEGILAALGPGGAILDTLAATEASLRER